jgi:RNA polymerase primary sigma factor
MSKVWSEDLVLARAAQGGDLAKAELLIHRVDDDLRTVCCLLATDHVAASEMLEFVRAGLRADGFRSLRAYDGRSRIETFVSLVARDLLADRIVPLLDRDASQGWLAFEAMFREGIERVIRCHVSDEDMRPDVWQEICVKLVRDDFRLFREHDNGKCSFGVLVLMVAESVARDFQRSLHGRKRLPENIKSLPTLAQEVYRRVYWYNSAGDAETLADELQHLIPPPTATEAAAALELVRVNLPPGHSPYSLARSRATISLSVNPQRAEECRSPEPTPEDAASMEEQKKLLRKAVSDLPDQARQCLLFELCYDLSPGEIARLMGLKVEYVYKIRQRALERIKKEFPGMTRKEFSGDDRQTPGLAARGGARK